MYRHNWGPYSQMGTNGITGVHLQQQILGEGTRLFIKTKGTIEHVKSLAEGCSSALTWSMHIFACLCLCQQCHEPSTWFSINDY